MAAVTCRALLKEIRIAKGSDYRNTLVYKYVLEQFRRNQVTEPRTEQKHDRCSGHTLPRQTVTGAQLCRERMEALHTARSYLCLHERYHARGERATEQVAGLVGLRLPTQPGGKGWET
ncbi:protein FMC1 homolog isoform X1 [Onychostoma macrolepis]|uniref:protein FMC1 homolog isoform X1 n=1 Tax=Onychostoma macrolepis TaxID=369639 RepID=UPI00272A091B|nr:protein FMC1 homolog isoform X1 [Onychostoma macrolepis]